MLLRPAPADWMEQAAVPVPGPLTDRICALAVETGLWLVPGTVFERAADGRAHNTALAVSPQGEIVARYRKVFPWQPYEQAVPDSEFVVFDIPGTGRIGLAICYDGSFPETVRQLAWLGAEVVIQPTPTTTRDRDMELVCARANAWTNQLYVVNLNAADPAGVGASAIVVDVLDLDTVTRVRRYGSAGINRPWDQLARHGEQIHLPMYGGTFRTPHWLGDGDGGAGAGAGAGQP